MYWVPYTPVKLSDPNSAPDRLTPNHQGRLAGAVEDGEEVDLTLDAGIVDVFIVEEGTAVVLTADEEVADEALPGIHWEYQSLDFVQT